MQADFFVIQDTNNSFLMNCAGETGISEQISGSLKGPNAARQEEMGFLSTLIGIAHDQDTSQEGKNLIPTDLVLGEDIPENIPLINLKKLSEDGTPGLRVDVASMDPDQSGKDNSNSNESTSVSSSIEGQEEGGQRMRNPLQAADQTIQKAVGDNSAKASSFFTSTEENRPSLKSAIPSVDFTTQKTDSAPCSIGTGEDAGLNSKSDNVHIFSDQTGNESDNTNSNKIIKLSTNFDRPENNASFEIKSIVKSMNPETENLSIHRDDKEAEKELLSKLQINAKHLSEERGTRGIREGQTRAPMNVNLAAPNHNLSTKPQENDEGIKHLYRDLPFEEISVKSKPGFQDMGVMGRKAGFFPKDLTNAKTDIMGAQTKESNLSFLNSQPQERSSEIIAPSKDTDLFQKPLQTEVIKQIVDRTAMNLNTGRTVIRINLKPESLGHLRLQITTENHQVMLKVMTEVPFVKEIIENNINQLKTALHVHGMQIDDFDVFVAHDSDQHGGGYENAKFSSMGNEPLKEDLDDILPEEEHVTPLTEGMSEENLIDFFA